MQWIRRTTWATLAALVMLGRPLAAQAGGFQDPLLDRLIGEWVLEGTIAGEEVTHDLVFEWVLGHQYLQFHEVARERDADGAPAYEAIVFIGWDQASQRYACLWLDSTGGDGLKGEAIGYAERNGDTIPFVFRMPDGGTWHTTFGYQQATDTWQWSMESLTDGVRQPFALVTLSRK